MTVHVLEEPPGSRCFVCAQSNEAGLGLRFEYDDGAGVVTTGARFGELHCGAPTYVHVGLTLAVLNEAMAWAVVATSGRFAIVDRTDARLLHPLRAGVAYRFEARAGAVSGATVEASAVALDAAGRTCASGAATFRLISEVAARRLRARMTTPARATPGRDPRSDPGDTAPAVRLR